MKNEALEYAPAAHQRLALANGLAVPGGAEVAPRHARRWLLLAVGISLGVAVSLASDLFAERARTVVAPVSGETAVPLRAWHKRVDELNRAVCSADSPAGVDARCQAN